MKEYTWKPEANLMDYGGDEIVREWHTKNAHKIDPKKVAYMIEHIEHKTDIDEAIMHLMKKHKLRGTLSQWRPGYTDELEQVLARRYTELFGEDCKRVMKEEKVVSLRMNPEPKNDGRNKMRLLVKGFMEPPEWDIGVKCVIRKYVIRALIRVLRIMGFGSIIRTVLQILVAYFFRVYQICPLFP